MAERRKLLWHHLAPLWGILMISFVLVGGLSSSSVSGFYYQETERHLVFHLNSLKRSILPLVRAKDSEGLDRFCKETARNDFVRLTVIYPSGVVAGDSQGEPAKMANHADRPEVNTALKGKRGVSIRQSATLKQEFLYVAVPLYQEGRIVGVGRIAMPNDFLRETLTSIFEKIFFIGLIAALLMLLISFFVYQRLHKTSEDLIKGASHYAKGEFDHEITLDDDSYLEPLSVSLNLMASQLNQRITEVNERERDLNILLGSMSEAIVAVNAEGNITRANAAFIDLFELGAQPLEKQSVWSVVFCSELHDFIRLLLRGEHPEPVEMEYSRGGQRLSLVVSGNLLSGRGVPEGGGIVVLTDITRIKRLEQIRKDFVANVSHELKTPITVIKGCGETLMAGLTTAPPVMHDFLERLLTQTERLERIVEDLLSLSRMEAGEKAGFAMNEQKVLSLVRQSVTLLEERVQARNVTISLSIEETLTFVGNAPLLIQAFTNLLDNAIKYGRENSTVTVVGELTPDHVVLSFSDEGEGIEPIHLERLFERFYRVDKGRSKALGGTGLGLAIVKHIVKLHGGTVTVSSTPGKGSAFRVSLPRQN